MLLEHRTQLRLLRPQWTSVLQSDIQIKSAISGAAETANRLLGIQSTPVLDWMPTVILQTQELLDDAYDVFSASDIRQDVEDSEDLIAGDDIEDEVGGLVESDCLAPHAAADIIWTMPVSTASITASHNLTPPAERLPH